MQNWNDPRTTGLNAASVGVPRAARDAGLRSYMLSVYNYMTSGVLLTGIVALLFYTSGLAAQVMQTPLQWVLIFAPLGFVFAMSFGILGCRDLTGDGAPWLSIINPATCAKTFPHFFDLLEELRQKSSSA